MSLWRRDAISVGWESSRIAIARRRGRSVVDARSEPVAPEAPLSKRLEALARLAGDARRSDAEVVVSDRFARYFPFPRLPGVRNVDEMATTVMAIFEERFGQSAGDWELRFDAGPLSARGFACALPRSLVGGLREALSDIGVPRARITTFYCASVNANAHAIPATAWVAARADGQTTLGGCADGMWQTVRALEGDGAEGLCELIGRERLRGLMPEADAPALALGSWPDAEPGVRRLGPDAWPGRGVSFSADYRVALAGVWN